MGHIPNLNIIIFFTKFSYSEWQVTHDIIAAIQQKNLNNMKQQAFLFSTYSTALIISSFENVDLSYQSMSSSLSFGHELVFLELISRVQKFLSIPSSFAILSLRIPSLLHTASVGNVRSGSSLETNAVVVSWLRNFTKLPRTLKFQNIAF